MAGPSEAGTQEILARLARRGVQVKTYKLVKADNQDLRQIRDSEDNLWFLEEQFDSARPVHHRRPVYDVKTTTSQNQVQEEGRHTTSQAQPRYHQKSVRRSCLVDAKKEQSNQRQPAFVDTELEARSSTTPRNAQWAQREIHATSRTRQSGPQTVKKADGSGSKNTDFKSTKSHAAPKQGKPKRVRFQDPVDASHGDTHIISDPISHSEDVSGDTNLRRRGAGSRATNHSQKPEAVNTSSQDRARHNSTALSTNWSSPSREVLNEDRSDEDPGGSTIPTVVNRHLPTVKPLNQHHQPGTSNDADAEETSKRPLARSNCRREATSLGGQEISITWNRLRRLGMFFMSSTTPQFVPY